MPALVAGIHVFAPLQFWRRGWPGRARPWRLGPRFRGEERMGFMAGIQIVRRIDTPVRAHTL